MKIRIARPEDPEGAALWDEAKRVCDARADYLIAAIFDEDPIDYKTWAEEIRAKASAVIAAREPCLCGKRTDCACRMRLPISDDMRQLMRDLHEVQVAADDYRDERDEEPDE